MYSVAKVSNVAHGPLVMNPQLVDLFENKCVLRNTWTRVCVQDVITSIIRVNIYIHVWLDIIR